MIEINLLYVHSTCYNSDVAAVVVFQLTELLPPYILWVVELYAVLASSADRPSSLHLNVTTVTQHLVFVV